MKKTIFIFVFFFNVFLFGQALRIENYLKRIESGESQQVLRELQNLQTEYPDDPGLLFLEAVLTINGTDALQKYRKIVDVYPEFKYSDAALYRIFSYYFAVGEYKKADETTNELARRFPSSPYLQFINAIPPPREDNPVIVKNDRNSESHTTQKKHGFTVQAGAFLNPENAQSLRDELIKAGYSSGINTKSVGGSLLNIVRVGSFESENDAAPLLNLLKTKYNLNGRVIISDSQEK